MDNSIIVIGAGASGLMAAGTAASRGKAVLLIEKQPKPARKVMITGKGRCNVTNKTDLNGLISAVPRNGRFLYSAFSACGTDDIMRFFEKHGVKLKFERGNRVFPESDKATEIVDALVSFAKKNGCEIITGRVKKLLTTDDTVCGVQLEDGREFNAKSVIISTGGMSYPLTGSTGDGYMLAKSVGHTITKTIPSLIPLTVHEGWCSKLQGLSLRNVAIKLNVAGKNKPVYSDFGEMLFTHYGLTGPIILSASAHMTESKSYTIEIDLKPALSFEILDTRMLKDFEKYANKDFINSLDDLLPRKLIPVIVGLSGIAPETKVNQITKEERLRLCKLLKGLKLHITGFRPIEEAIVTRGGIKVSEINPKTMESKIIKNLYFSGEVIDVDAYTGGFNLQIAFSTGYLAGSSV